MDRLEPGFEDEGTTRTGNLKSGLFGFPDVPPLPGEGKAPPEDFPDRCLEDSLEEPFKMLLLADRSSFDTIDKAPVKLSASYSGLKHGALHGAVVRRRGAHFTYVVGVLVFASHVNDNNQFQLHVRT